MIHAALLAVALSLSVTATADADYLRNVPYYYQRANAINPSGSCQNTTIAITLGHYGGQLHPDDLSARYGTSKAQTIKGWQEIFNTEARRYGLAVRDSAVSDATMDDIDRLLDAGLPVPVHGGFTDSGHLVVILGRAGDDYYVHDPYGDWSRGYAGDNPVAGRYARYPRDLLPRVLGDPIQGFIRMHIIQPAPAPMGLRWTRALPDSLVAGQTVDLAAQLAVGAGLSVSAVADLSALGGDARVPLAGGAAGLRLQARLGLDPGLHGFRPVSVTVTGDTTVVLRHEVAVLPATDDALFDDGLSPDWQEAQAINISAGPAATPVYAGQRSLALRSQGGYYEWSPRRPLTMHGFETLRFVVHPGDAVPGRVPALSVMVNGDSRTVIKLLEPGPQGPALDLSRAEWQVVEIPMSQFQWLEAPLETLRIFGNLSGTFYLDDVRLVADRPFPYAFGLQAAGPDTVVQDAPLHLDLAVRLEGGADLPTPTVRVDLSALGGPTELALGGSGEVYRLDHVLPEGVPAHGRYEIPLRIEQPAGDRLHRARLVHRVVVLPAADAPLYDDALAPRWTEAMVRNVTVETDESVAFQGAAALRLTAETFVYELTTSTPVEPVGYRALRLAFRADDVDGGREPAFSVMLNGDSRVVVALIDGPLGDGGIRPDAAGWQVVEIPMAAFAPLNQPVHTVRLFGNLAGTFHLDDVRFVADRPPPATAVAASAGSAAATPADVALLPGYPNPFNPSVTLGFRLPAAAPVEVTVHDLLGQRVAMLASGVRPAGTHRLRWDGTDAAGQPVASGVYLVRLHAGGQTRVSKLTLLR